LPSGIIYKFQLAAIGGAQPCVQNGYTVEVKIRFKQNVRELTRIHKVYKGFWEPQNLILLDYITKLVYCYRYAKLNEENHYVKRKISFRGKNPTRNAQGENGAKG